MKKPHVHIRQRKAQSWLTWNKSYKFISCKYTQNSKMSWQVSMKTKYPVSRKLPWKLFSSACPDSFILHDKNKFNQKHEWADIFWENRVLCRDFLYGWKMDLFQSGYSDLLISIFIHLIRYAVLFKNGKDLFCFVQCKYSSTNNCICMNFLLRYDVSKFSSFTLQEMTYSNVTVAYFFCRHFVDRGEILIASFQHVSMHLSQGKSDMFKSYLSLCSFWP